MDLLFGKGSPSPIVSPSDAMLITGAALLEGLSAEEAGLVVEDAKFTDQLVKDEIVTERTIIKLDKKARLKGATRTAVYTIARQRKDPKFKKLLTLWRMEAQLDKELFKKYYNEALRKAKDSMRRKELPSGNGKHKEAVRGAIAKAKAQLKPA